MSDTFEELAALQHELSKQEEALTERFYTFFKENEDMLTPEQLDKMIDAIPPSVARFRLCRIFLDRYPKEWQEMLDARNPPRQD